jgi:hypothetical protein
MSKTTIGKIAGTSADTAKEVRGSIATNDNATVNDTNYPPDNATTCAGWQSVMVQARGNGGALTTVTVTPLHRLGTAWAAGTPVVLTDGAQTTINVMGRDTFFRITALTLGAATSVSLWAAGWSPFRYDGPRVD